MAKHIGDETRESLNKLFEALKRDRQRLQVQINLGHKELRDEWSRVEENWSEVEHHLSDFTEESMQRAGQLGRDLAAAYRSFKERLDAGKS